MWQLLGFKRHIYMTDIRERFMAVLLSVLLVLSLVAIAGAGLAGSAVATEGIETQSTDTSAAPATVDPALDNAEGTEEVYIILDQYDGELGDDREQAIARLKEFAAESQATVTADLDTLSGVEVINTYWITNAVRAEVDTTAVDTAELASIEGVRTIQLKPEYQVTEPVNQSAADATPDADEFTYGLEQVNASETWNDFGTQGEDVKVAVLDTGFDVSHPDLDLYTEDADDPTYPGGWVEIGPDGEPVEGSEPHDTHYHGTHVGGTVGADAPTDGETPAYGVAPNVDLQHALVLPGGSGADSDTLAGFEYVIEDMDTDVVSMSFGAGCGLFGPVYDDAWIPAIQNANDAGVVAVTSAGNSGEGCVGSPANIYDSFGIGASDEDGNIADFSSGDTIAGDNWDEPDPEWPDEWIKPDVSAPGADVLSAAPGGEYDTLSGTSMAAPHTSGVIALMLGANDDLTAEEVQSTLEETAWKPDDAPDEKDVRYGHGIIDAHAAVDEVAAGALEYELGDVDQDESLTVQDVQLTQQYLQDMEPEPFAQGLADLDRDGEVTTTDLNLLQQKVQGTLTEGEITISGLDVPDEVDQGETLEVTVDLENPGDEGAVQELNLSLNDTSDEPVATEVVDMAAPGVDDPIDHPAETTITVELDTAAMDGDTYTLTVTSEDDDASAEFTVRASNFEVTSLDAPAEADRGEEITVNATVENTGNVDDTQSVEYRFDDLDDALLAQNVTLAPGDDATVSFEADTANVSAGTYEHGVFTEDDAATDTIDIHEAFFSVDITDAPAELAPGESYNVSAVVENTGGAPGDQEVVYELGEGDVAVVDVAADTSQGEAVASVLDDRLNNDTYTVDVVTADTLLDAMDDYDTFVIQRFGSDTIASDFLDELEETQSAVYLDSHQGGTAETYADGVFRLNNVREDPAERDSEGLGTSSDPVTIDIDQDHAVFAGVGEPGDTVEMYTGTTTWGSWFDNYSGTTLATADYGGDYAGPSVAVSDDGSEVLLTATGRDYFTNEPDFTDEANQLLTNAVEFATTGGVTAEAETVDNTTLVSLEPGESEQVPFSDTVPADAEAGDASHIVASADEQDFVSVTIDDGPNWAVKGTVADAATDEPIANASVELEAGNETYTNVTDADGQYGLANVPAGEHELTVTAENYTDRTVSVDVPENETVTKDIALDTLSGTISGEVTASDDGKPVENVTVVAENGDGEVYETTTDENGTYELDGVSAGTYVVDVADTPPGFEPEEVITVAPGEHVDGVDFEIDRTAGSIEGYVTNAAGIPIAEANVVDADNGAFNATTNESGYYEITNVTPGTNALRATADGYDDSNVEFVEVETGETTIANLTLGTYFEVGDLAAPDTAAPGENITVNATVTNTGDQTDTRTVFYFPPGTDFGPDVIDTQNGLSETVTLNGGESTTVEFTYEIPAGDEPGEYEHGISADEVESTTITIDGDDGGDATFDVSELDAPATAGPGETVSANATVENTGDAAGTQNVTYAFDNETVAETTVSLDANETAMLEFTADLPDAEGTYEHVVASANASATAQTTVENDSEPDPAYFEVTELAGPDVVDSGDELTINATITNTGDELDEQDVFLFWDTTAAEIDLEDGDRSADERREAGVDSMATIELDGGESETVSLTYAVENDTEPGTYQYTVSTLQEMVDGEVTVEASDDVSILPVRGGHGMQSVGTALLG